MNDERGEVRHIWGEQPRCQGVDTTLTRRYSFGLEKPPDCCIIVAVGNETSKGGFAGLRVLSLESRGAQVTRVPVYEWGLPENVEPLRAAVSAIARDEFDVILLTTGIQVNHLFQVAAEMNQEDAMRQGLSKTLIASIGPVTSERLREYGLQADIEPTHPKMGYLVSETAQRSAEILRQKRSLTK